MSIIAWVILGLIAGFIGSKIVNKTGEGLTTGVVVAVAGGCRFSLFGTAPVSGRNIYSLIVAVIGAIIVLWFMTLSPAGAGQLPEHYSCRHG